MAEAPSSRYVSFDVSKPDSANKAPENGHGTSSAATSTSAMDLLLCDYVKLRKVRGGTQKGKRTAIDKKLQKWKKGWLVLTTKALLDCTLEYYKDEDEWRTPSKSTKAITISELLKGIVTVEHMQSSYKSHVMCIIFDHYSVLIDFKSRATMESWIAKINNIRDYFLVQLTTSSNDAIKPGTYLIHVQDKKLVGYDAMDHHKIAWTWDPTDLYGFRLQKNIVPEIEIVIGAESPAHGNFHFIGPSLAGMCDSVMVKVLSLSSDEKDNLLEDLPDTTSGKSTRPIGKFKEWKQASLLNINPSYGVLPRLPENTEDDMYDVVQVYPKNVEETKGATIKEVVYANDLPKHPKNAEVTKGATIKSAVYDDVQIQPKHGKETQGDAIKEVVYANDLPKRPKNAEVTKGATVISAVYDDVQIQPKHVKETQGGTIKEVIYANDPTAVVEEHEYL